MNNKPTDHTAGLVTGLGGVFFKTEDTEATQKWYKEHLGLGMVDSDTAASGGGTMTIPIVAGTRFGVHST